VQFRDDDLARKVHENARRAQEVVDEAVRDSLVGELELPSAPGASRVPFSDSFTRLDFSHLAV
jgi:hypothetical protein